MKEKILGILFSIALVMVLLITSFEIGAYGSWSFYQKEYEKYEVAEQLHMEMTDIMSTTKYMMSYLRGGEEELVFVTQIEGEEKDFFNEQDRFHMGEVKELFLGGLALRRIALVLCVGSLLGLLLMKCDWIGVLLQMYRRTLVGLFAIVIVLGILIAQNFSKAFEIFHHIFFDNDLWLFDPRYDYMIRMLPEGFFSDIVLRIGSIFICFLIVSLLINIIISKTNKSNKI